MHEFVETIQSNLGFAPAPEKLQPGQMVRFSVSDKAHDDAGWAKLFLDGCGGVYGDFRRGISKTWQSSTGSGQIDARTVKAAQAEAKKALANDHAKAVAEADREWKQASGASPDHPYLTRKQVQQHNLKQAGDMLLIRLRDAVSKTTGLQYISPDGTKRFKKHSKLAGSFATIGQLDGSQSLLVCEGWATGASLHEATGYPVAVAFSAGNLQLVVGTFRRKYKDLDIIICADDDRRNSVNTGLETAKAVAKATKSRWTVPEFPDTADFSATDFNDLVCMEGDNAVRDCINKAIDPNDTNDIKDISYGEFQKMYLEPRNTLLSPWLFSQGSAMVFAWRGTGKTHFSLGVAYAVATGGSFLGWQAARPAKVLFIDGEMPAVSLQERLAAIDSMHSQEQIELACKNLRIITPDLQPETTLDLSDISWQVKLEKRLQGVELIIVDSIMTLCRKGKPNDAESWEPVAEWIARQHKAGRSILFVHHSGKSGEQLGTSTKEIRLETVIKLKQPCDHNQEGAAFEVHFDKHREFYGEEARPLSVALSKDQDGKPCWLVKTLEASDEDKVVQLLDEGLTQKEIAEYIGKSEATVSRIKNKILRRPKTPADAFIDAISQ